MDSVHHGHRKRLRQRFEAEGFMSFQPHEVLEYLLMQIVARRDVNPLAHSLIDRFGSVNGVLHAEKEELMAVTGVGEKTADFLLAAGKDADDCMTNWTAPKARIGQTADALEHLEKGRVILLGLDRTGRILEKISFAVQPSLPETVEALLIAHASGAIVLNGLEGRVTEETMRRALALEEILSMVDITLVDCISGGQSLREYVTAQQGASPKRTNP